MRIPIVGLLAAAGLLCSTTTAGAFAFRHSVRGGLRSTYSSNSTVTVDVFGDFDPDFVLLGLGVLVEDGVLSYDPAASTALPVIYPAPPASYYTTGNHPGYILYTPGIESTIVYPYTDKGDPFGTWPGADPGVQQVNVNYSEASLGPASASGTNIWIASLVFDIPGPFTSTEISISLEAGGNVLGAFVGEDYVEIDPSTVPLSAPITLTGELVPEPSTTLLDLIGLGLVVMAAAGRRRQGGVLAERGRRPLSPRPGSRS